MTHLWLTTSWMTWLNQSKCLAQLNTALMHRCCAEQFCQDTLNWITAWWRRKRIWQGITLTVLRKLWPPRYTLPDAVRLALFQAFAWGLIWQMYLLAVREQGHAVNDCRVSFTYNILEINLQLINHDRATSVNWQHRQPRAHSANPCVAYLANQSAAFCNRNRIMYTHAVWAEHACILTTVSVRRDKFLLQPHSF